MSVTKEAMVAAVVAAALEGHDILYAEIPADVWWLDELPMWSLTSPTVARNLSGVPAYPGLRPRLRIRGISMWVPVS